MSDEEPVSKLLRLEIEKKKINLYVESDEVKNMNKFRIAERRLDQGIYVSQKSGLHIPNPVNVFQQAFSPYNDFCLKALEQGIVEARPLQAQGWPVILSGHDVLCVGGAGSGKTLTYLMPVILFVQKQPTTTTEWPTVVCLSPSLESASEVKSEADNFKYENTKCTHLDGTTSVSRNEQHEMVVTTPEEFHESLEKGDIDMSSVSVVVLEKVDELNDSQIREINSILSRVTQPRQVIITSTTWCNNLKSLSSLHCPDAMKIWIDSFDLTKNQSVKLKFIVEKEKKRSTLDKAVEYLRLHNGHVEDRVIVFCQDIDAVLEVVSKLGCLKKEDKIPYKYVLRSNNNSNDSLKPDVKTLVTGDVKTLVTDDPNLDLNGMAFSHVLNFTFPEEFSIYVEQIFKAHKNSQKLELTTLLSSRDSVIVPDLIAILRKTKQVVEPDLYDLANSFERIAFHENPQFPTLVNLHYYVDKSMMLDKIIKGGRDQYLFTAPSKMGKTAILGMCNFFFNLAYSEHEEVKLTFQKLKIAQKCPEIVDEHRGKYPVLEVNMSWHGVIIDSVETCEKALRSIIHVTYKHYKHIPFADEKHQLLMKRWTTAPDYLSIQSGEIDSALDDLAMMLHHHYKKEVVFLCDEFDDISRVAFTRKVPPKVMERIIFKYFSIFHGIIKADSAVQVEKTGAEPPIQPQHSHVENIQADTVVQVQETDAKSSIRPQLSNADKSDEKSQKEDPETWRLIYKAIFVGITAITSTTPSRINTLRPEQFLTSESFSEFFGVTMTEFDELLNKPIFERLREEKRLALSRYNGYRTCKGVEILCTYSLGRYLSSLLLEPVNRLQNYWKQHQTSIDKFADFWRTDDVHPTLKEIVYGSDIHITKTESMSSVDLAMLGGVTPVEKVPGASMDTLYTYFQQLGYLTIVYEESGLDLKSNIAKLRIPNEEIRGLFSEVLAEIYIANFCEDALKINLITTNCLMCARHFNELSIADKRIDAIKNIEATLKSLCKTRKTLNEAMFEQIVHTALIYSIYHPVCQLPIENKSESDRRKWKFYREDFGIVVELKFGDGQSSAKAFKQIKDNKYYQVLRNGQLGSTISKELYLGLHVTPNGQVSISCTDDIDSIS